MSRSTTTGTAPQTSKPATPQTNSSVPMDKIAKLAYEMWVKAGCKHGCDQQHWYEAEAELKAQAKK